MRDNTAEEGKKPSHFSYFILFHFFPMLANIRSTRKREKRHEKNTCINVSADAHKTQICVLYGSNVVVLSTNE